MENAPERSESISELTRLLTVHPEFHILPVKNNPSGSRSAAILGNALASLASIWSVAAFEHAISLLWRRTLWNPGSLEIDLFWHVRRVSGDCWVFLHGVDSAGNIAFQDDFSLAVASPSPFGFLYTRRSIALPGGLPPGRYKLRVGIWVPGEARHLPLTRRRGFLRESGDWYNAVILNFSDI